MKYRLQELMMVEDDKLENHWEMFYQKSKLARNAREQRYVLGANMEADFLTYFNSFSLAKWRKYAKVDNLCLCIRAKGEFEIVVSGYFRPDFTSKKTVCRKAYVLSEITEIDLDIPDMDAAVIGFEIHAGNVPFYLYQGGWDTEIAESEISDVELALVTTTFQKEEFIIPNIELLKNRILKPDGEIAGHFQIHVVDNGRTLDSEKMECAGVKIHPNINVGGSGGFARGMLEAMRQEKKATHVLLMDDDVIIQPESIKKTYALLRILREEYREHFISGAMLFYEEMNVQHEDVGFVHKDGSYGPLKNRKYLNKQDEVVENELEDREEDNSYCGWWYCCIPVSVIKKIGLPLPLFVRGDDVDYSLRHKAKFITMNGICIWHMGFVSKFNAAMELYQVHRNSLIIQAVDNICGDIDFAKRIFRFTEIELKRFNYDSAELLLESVEDYMKGPEFLKNVNGEELMRRQAAKNEKLVPLSEFSGMDPDKVYQDIPPVRNIFLRALYRFTYNGHGVPRIFLRKEPEAIAYDWFYTPYKAYFRTSLLAVNTNNKTAHMRTRDNKRFREIYKRYKRTVKNYEMYREKTEESWRKEREYMISEEFWKQYLGID